MSEGIRFRRESAPFNLVLAMSKSTKMKTETTNECLWQLDLPKNLSVEDFVGKFLQVIFDDEDTAALGSMSITCAITNVMAMTLATGVSSITATAKFVAPFISITGDIVLSISYRIGNGKTMATLSTPATGDGT